MVILVTCDGFVEDDLNFMLEVGIGVGEIQKHVPHG